MFDTIGQKLRDLMIWEMCVRVCVHQLVSRIHLSLVDNENENRELDENREDNSALEEKIEVTNPLKSICVSFEFG